ncbi:cytochrome c [Aestuariicoccus sp. MJ-SS9]|uniref:cytochrome c n=1 Tax=Aestuariicoccus sp. MJ-SS9 TaxID=3079855 RepID=UPI00290E1673|nr:cytochrome c [Aestuariicoccus sp. MJ-SS9]MDU8911532.1 cytochrome c [Aestuariicoccus sp. MJ-SS9]
MRPILTTLALIALAALGAGFWITRPATLPEAAFADVTGDAARGEAVFTAAGCASCHYAPGAEGQAKLVLAGGQRFASPYGTFLAPNISPDPDHGVGAWSQRDFAQAVLLGTSPQGKHYFPAFPYTAYSLMDDRDVADLWAYIQTLPASDTPSLPHEIGFPFNIRRSIGVWKALYLGDDWVMTDTPTPELTRGRYLVEALAHCGECHTPRDALGGLDRAQWMAGAPNPSGTGRIPPLTPDQFTWSATDIVYYLETGFTPDFDSAGGHMVSVIENFAKLPSEDRAAVAAYIKALPAP